MTLHTPAVVGLVFAGVTAIMLPLACIAGVKSGGKRIMRGHVLDSVLRGVILGLVVGVVSGAIANMGGIYWLIPAIVLGMLLLWFLSRDTYVCMKHHPQ